MMMNNHLAILLLLLTGCSAQRYEEIRVWTSSNAPPDPAWVQIGDRTTAVHTICIQADNARLQDLVRRIAEHENLGIRFDAQVANAFCTVSLTDVEPIAGLASILEMHGCGLVQTNTMLIVREKENPEQGGGHVR
jgi:hypothetical protein